MSEINDIKELPEGGFPINFKLIYQYQRKYPSLMIKYKTGCYKAVIFVDEVVLILTL